MSRLRRSAATVASGLLVGSGLANAARWQRRRRGDHRVFILEYHNVLATHTEPEGCISAERFRQHVRYLKRSFRLASLSEAIEALREPRSLREDLVAITLDDGYAGNYEAAWPVLREERAPAAVFVCTGFLDGSELWFDVAARCLEAARRVAGGLASTLQDDLRAALGRWPLGRRSADSVERLKRLSPAKRDRLLSRLRAACPPLTPPARALLWDQVREMQAAGVEIGCHTVTHPILSSQSPAQQEDEIVRSRDRITAETGVAPAYFAYPNGAAGDFDADTIRIVRAAGFKAACTTIRGSNRPVCDLFTLRRIGVGADSLPLLAARLAGAFDDDVRAVLRKLSPSRGNTSVHRYIREPDARQARSAIPRSPFIRSTERPEVGTALSASHREEIRQ